MRLGCSTLDRASTLEIGQSSGREKHPSIGYARVGQPSKAPATTPALRRFPHVENPAAEGSGRVSFRAGARLSPGQMTAVEMPQQQVSSCVLEHFTSEKQPRRQFASTWDIVRIHDL